MAVSKVDFSMKMQESSPEPSRFPGLIQNPAVVVYTFSVETEAETGRAL